MMIKMDKEGDYDRDRVYRWEIPGIDRHRNTSLCCRHFSWAALGASGRPKGAILVRATCQEVT